MYKTEFSNETDAIVGMVVPFAQAAMEIFLTKHKNAWDAFPCGKIIDLKTGMLCAYYTVELDEYLNLTDTMWVSGEFINLMAGE